MKRHCVTLCLAAGVVLAAVTAGAQNPPATHRTLRYLPHDSSYSTIKARLDAAGAAPAVEGPTGPVGSNPVVNAGFAGRSGANSGDYSPSDANGAIGSTQYVETVNAGVGVYSRTGGLLSSN